MRTTVEITDEQHRALAALARRRGMRGFSSLVQEAIDGYLAGLESVEVETLLALEGVLDDAQESEVRTRVEAARASWRTA